MISRIGMAAIKNVAYCTASCLGSSTERTTGNQHFSHHAATCSTDIDSQAGHEAIDLLADLQE